MRLGRQSSNVEDRRGSRVGLVAGGGIGAIVLTLLALFLGVDPSTVIPPQTESPQSPSSTSTGPLQDEGGKFVSQVLADTEETWNSIFRDELGRDYEEPRLVLFTDLVQSQCGLGQAAAGPFYCPLDSKVYIDLGFYAQLRERFGAPGDFAQAYVIGHEVGHHVQTQLGVSQQVQSARERARSQEEANDLSVRQELQADCFAGVWANQSQKTRNTLEPGDIEEGLNAASAIGDDRMQRESRGHVTPESWTHGSSAMRVRWFKQGYQTGDIKRCDTFAASSL